MVRVQIRDLKVGDFVDTTREHEYGWNVPERFWAWGHIVKIEEMEDSRLIEFADACITHGGYLIKFPRNHVVTRIEGAAWPGSMRRKKKAKA